VLLFAIEISAGDVVSFVLGGIAVGGAAVSVYDKRRRELTETYRQLYEAKSDKVEELETELRALQAQVDLLLSDFTAKLAQGITDALHRIYKEKEQEHELP
jgi:hypothetical protein